eukprot:jgi/Chlat1/1367/Chrsp119S01789
MAAVVASSLSSCAALPAIRFKKGRSLQSDGLKQRPAAPLVPRSLPAALRHAGRQAVRMCASTAAATDGYYEEQVAMASSTDNSDHSRRALLVAAGVGGAVASAKLLQGTDAAKLYEEIQNVNDALCTALSKQRWTEFASYFTEDCRLLVSGRDVIAGREDLIKFSTEYARHSGAVNSQVSIDELIPLENATAALERGSYQTVSEQGNTVDLGRYLCFWRKVNGSWLIFSQANVSDYIW